MRLNTVNVLAGAVFFLLGLYFLVSAYLNLDLGSLRRPGPGGFPILLASVLIIISIPIALQRQSDTQIGWDIFAWRPLVFATAAPVIFGLTLHRLGFVPATVLSILASTFAERLPRPLYVVLLTGGLTLLCYLLFSVGLKLPMQAFGPWLRWF